MDAEGGKLGRKQEQAIAALLSEKTVEEAAVKAGCAYRTLKGWLTEPAFKTAFAEARTAVLERTVARLVKATGKAVDTLEANLEAEKDSDSNRAAVAILEHATRGVELLDMKDKLAELERLVKELKGA